MQDSIQTRRDFALFWKTFWPSAGATFGATLGGVIGICVGGILAGLAFAILGGLIGAETGEFFGAFLQGLFFPWVELVNGGKWGPLAGGIAGAGLLATLALELKAGITSTVFLSCCGFACGAWLVILARLMVDLAHRRPHV